MKTIKQIFRGHVVDIYRDASGKAKFKNFVSGQLEVQEDGKIAYCGAERPATSESIPVTHVKSGFIFPGFTDLHLHFPQTDMIGSFGEDLLGWLSKYTFPTEMKFANKEVASSTAKRFVDSMLACGTTTSCVFSSSHYEATDLLFAESARRGIRSTIGLVSMDQLAPQEILTSDLEKHEHDFDRLAKSWHGHEDRLSLAITPRFAPSCSEELLKLNSKLADRYKDAVVQTHFAENEDELILVSKTFSRFKDYLAVYEDFGLLGPKTILAHAIHFSDSEMDRLKKSKTKIAHCPSSNLFLGSGIMPWSEINNAGIDFAMASDVGAGTSFSMWKVMGDGYKSQRLNGLSIESAELFARATIDGAKILRPASKDHGLSVGALADFQIVDPSVNSLASHRISICDSIEEIVFTLMWYWESNMTRAVYIDGKLCYQHS